MQKKSVYLTHETHTGEERTGEIQILADPSGNGIWISYRLFTEQYSDPPHEHSRVKCYLELPTK